jgi:hypothetical protein
MASGIRVVDCCLNSRILSFPFSRSCKFVHPASSACRMTYYVRSLPNCRLPLNCRRVAEARPAVRLDPTSSPVVNSVTQGQTVQCSAPCWWCCCSCGNGHLTTCYLWVESTPLTACSSRMYWRSLITCTCSLRLWDNRRGSLISISTWSFRALSSTVSAYGLLIRVIKEKLYLSENARALNNGRFCRKGMLSGWCDATPVPVKSDHLQTWLVWCHTLTSGSQITYEPGWCDVTPLPMVDHYEPVVGVMSHPYQWKSDHLQTSLATLTSSRLT